MFIWLERELDIDAKKSVLNSLIKTLKVDRNRLLEIDFGVTLNYRETLSQKLLLIQIPQMINRPTSPLRLI